MTGAVARRTTIGADSRAPFDDPYRRSTIRFRDDVVFDNHLPQKPVAGVEGAVGSRLEIASRIDARVGASQLGTLIDDRKPI